MLHFICATTWLKNELPTLTTEHGKCKYSSYNKEDVIELSKEDSKFSLPKGLHEAVISLLDNGSSSDDLKGKKM